MTIPRELVICAAAFVAGAVNSVAGGGTLLSYPSLIWAGLNPIAANATSTVALWPGSLAGLYGYREDLRGTRHWLMLLAIPSLIGGALGAVLLLMTPEKVFGALVPWLILGATGLRAANAPIARYLERFAHHRETPAWVTCAIVFQFFVALYGGYFGAGIGIMMLAAFGLLGLTDIHQMNGLKCLFAVAINGVATGYFIWRGAVCWPEALMMAVAAIAGGFAGARVARKLGRTFANVAVVVIGLAMGLYLLLR
jgi:uncharacterized membrane protein YfcA